MALFRDPSVDNERATGWTAIDANAAIGILTHFIFSGARISFLVRSATNLAFIGTSTQSVALRLILKMPCDKKSDIRNVCVFYNAIDNKD